MTLGTLTYKRPVNLVIAVNVIAYGVLFFNSKPYDWGIPGLGFLTIIMICTIYLLIVKRNLGDEYIFTIVSMLVSLGNVMIYRLDPGLGLKQAVWFGAGIGMFLLSYYIFLKVKVWDQLVYFYIGASFLFFISTIILGKNIGGATNWILIRGYSFQPSELVKILFILFLACYFKEPDTLFKIRKYEDKRLKTLNRLILSFAAYMNLGFLILQREWGTAVLFLLIYLVILYVFGEDMRFLLANVLPAVPVGILGYYFLYHIKVRFDIWLNPWADISGQGYQIAQSLFAISTGGFFGTGIGRGRPDLIPAAHTDFIFSAICEEMGMFSGAAIVLLFLILVYRGFKIVLNTRDNFLKVVALGITTMFAFQTFIIIGGVIRLIPLTGITLPFISYGGSSLVTSFISLGILQAISKKSGEWGRKNQNEIQQ